MAGLHFKDSSSGGYFDREKGELIFGSDNEPLDTGERDLEDHYSSQIPDDTVYRDPSRAFRVDS